MSVCPVLKKVDRSYDFVSIIGEIKKKLLEENNRPVGIGQIITNIKKLLNKENTFDSGFYPETTFIYPLLVVHDNMYDAPGLNNILNVFFYEELEKLKNERFNISRVKPLILINIDTFIQISDALKQGKCTLHEIFEAFYKNAELLKDQVPSESEIKSTLVPFSVFTVNYLNQKLGSNWHSEGLIHFLFSQASLDEPESQLING